MSNPIGPGLPPATPVYSSTRAQALADGVLIDISEFSKEAYFRCPMAVTGNLFYHYLSPHYRLLSCGQSLITRIRDTLTVLKTAIYAEPKARQLTFTASFVMFIEHTPTPVPVQITATLGCDDDGKSVITLSLPEENVPQILA
jgi:hypothetical protein